MACHSDEMIHKLCAKSNEKSKQDVSNFDYIATRQAYFSELSKVFKNNYNSVVSGKSTEIASVETVKKIKELIVGQQRLDPVCENKKLTALLKSYQVIRQRGREVLAKKSSPSRRKILVLGYQSAFKVLCHAHIKNNHCGKDKLLSVLSDKYEIPNKCYEKFSDFCNFCCSKRSFNKHVQVSIINMPSPENNFQSVLLYKDLCTDYHLLRPITSDCQEEATIELLKIFTDFGIPLVMYVPAFEKDFFKLVLDNIQKFLPCNVTMVTMSQIDCKNNTTHIESMMKSWMEFTGSQDWAFGCYAVQMKLNTSKPTPEKESPYHQVFGDLAASLTMRLRECGNLIGPDQPSQ